jgi:hypothetical protein
MDTTTRPTTHTPNTHTPNTSYQPSTRWIGGVVRPHALRHRGKPMRVAAWADSSGVLIGAAIVEGHGPTVLRELFDELLGAVDAAARPSRLTVWPNSHVAFRGLEYPLLIVEHDPFLTLVVEDEADVGRISALPVRVGSPGA